MTRNNVFSLVDCWCMALKRAGCVMCWLLALKGAGFSLADVQSDALLPSCLHVTAFSIDQLLCRWRFVICLPIVSIRRCFKFLVTAAGLTDNAHTFLHQSTNFVGNRTVWRIQIWRDKFRCFLLKELDYFTSIEWRHNASLVPSQLFKSK